MRGTVAKQVRSAARALATANAAGAAIPLREYVAEKVGARRYTVYNVPGERTVVIPSITVRLQRGCMRDWEKRVKRHYKRVKRGEHGAGYRRGS